MFDTYVSRPEGPTYHSTHITEQRAPTDESLRLLREMDQKIRADILGSFRLSTNTFNAHWTVLREPLTAGLQCVCQFDLNGDRHSITIQLDERDLHFDRRGAMLKVCEAIKAALAERLTFELFRQARQELGCAIR